MSRTPIVMGVLAAALAAGCASGGSSEKLGPTVSAPTVNQAPDRTTATVAPTPAVADTSTPPAATPRSESRHVLPDGKAVRAPVDMRYEYRLYYYLPVNARGQNELGLLLQQLTRDGWELYQVQVAPVGHCSALFRRDKRVRIHTNPTDRMAPPAPPATGSGSGAASSSGNGTGTPSSLPPAPAR